jgi:hypothetical protein
LVQNEQPHARAATVGTDAGQSNATRMLPQWQLAAIAR